MPSRRKGFERTIAPLIDDFLLTEGLLKSMHYRKITLV